MARARDWRPYLEHYLVGRSILACNPATQTLATSDGDVIKFYLLAIYGSNWHKITEFGMDLEHPEELVITEVGVVPVPEDLLSLKSFYHLDLVVRGVFNGARVEVKLARSDGPYLLDKSGVIEMIWPHQVIVTTGESILEDADPNSPEQYFAELQ